MRPGGLAREQLEVDVGAERLVARVHVAGSPRGPSTSGGETKIWRSKRPGRSSAGSSFSSRLDAAITTRSPVRAKPSISTSSWLSVCSRSELLSEPRSPPTASISSMKMIAGRCLRASANRRRMRAAPRPANISTKRGGRLREELRAGLVGHGLGQQRLAGAGRAVQQDALRDLGAERVEALRVAQEVDDLLQLRLGLVGAGDVGPRDRADSESGLISLRLGPRHQLQRPPEEEARSAP